MSPYNESYLCFMKIILIVYSKNMLLGCQSSLQYVVERRWCENGALRGRSDR